jgi:hypothetical protein
MQKNTQVLQLNLRLISFSKISFRFLELDPFDFVCDHCGKKFLGIANMKRHLRVHMGTEGKDFACPLCHYRGCTTTHVKRHMAHKHLEK